MEEVPSQLAVVLVELLLHEYSKVNKAITVAVKIFFPVSIKQILSLIHISNAKSYSFY